MIRSFESELAKLLYHGVINDVSRVVEPVLRLKIARIFDCLNVVSKIESIKIPGIDNVDRFSRISDNVWRIRFEGGWCVVFKWFEGDVYNIDVIRG